jgi:acyl CoA:acetate/3-ketoacid CoA transferase beta subunit
MTHTNRGTSKIVPECSLPLTSERPVSLAVTELAVLEPTADGLVLRERAPGVSVDEIRSATEAELLAIADVPEMTLAA